jgi:hypothetical protein
MTSREAQKLHHGMTVYVVLPQTSPPRSAIALVEGAPLTLLKNTTFVSLLLRTNQRITLAAERVHASAVAAMGAMRDVALAQGR